VLNFVEDAQQFTCRTKGFCRPLMGNCLFRFSKIRHRQPPESRQTTVEGDR
jgi:hypothetical protein